MKLHRTDPAAGSALGAFRQGGATLAPVLKAQGPVFVGAIHLTPGASFGPHLPSAAQLLIVTRGSCWVRGPEGEHVAVGPGQGVSWEAQEVQELGTQTGFLGLMVEGPGLETLSPLLGEGVSGITPGERPAPLT